ncbi:MAG: hypothetical protein MUD01_22010 [Chloroflexaceae bacterium]|nr:hypothetical protein [Chloroflexaceae bacterium]
MTTVAASRSPLPTLSRLQVFGLLVGVVGVALVGLTFVALSPRDFYQAYLYGYIYAISFPLGCLGFLLVQHLTGGRWGVALRRVMEAGALTLPFMFILFLPILAGLVAGEQSPYHHWTNPALYVEGSPEFDPIVAHKEPYLNIPFFIGRAVFYFGVWTVLALILRSWSLRQDRTGDPKLVRNMRMLSGFGVVLFMLTASYALFDWGMSLDPHWFSTIYGVLFIVGDGIVSLALMLVMLRLLYDKSRISFLIDQHVNFSQYVIIWSGNVAEFTPWYQRRTEGGWQWFIIFLILFQFFVPFFMLLSRTRKRNINAVVWIGVWLIFMRIVDITFVILPEFGFESIFDVNPLYYAAPFGLAGIWLFLFVMILKRQPLLPMKDPNMAFLKYGGGGH